MGEERVSKEYKGFVLMEKLKCSECNYTNSKKQHRVLHITKEVILCDLCFKDLKRQQREMDRKRKRSKVPIV